MTDVMNENKNKKVILKKTALYNIKMLENLIIQRF